MAKLSLVYGGADGRLKQLVSKWSIEMVGHVDPENTHLANLAKEISSRGFQEAIREQLTLLTYRELHLLTRVNIAKRVNYEHHLRSGAFREESMTSLDGKKGGVFIPPDVMLDRRLKCGQKVLFSMILNLSEHNVQGCYASDDYFAWRIGVGKRQVRRMIHELESMQLIYRDESHYGRRTIIAQRECLRPENEEEGRWGKNRYLPEKT